MGAMIDEARTPVASSLDAAKASTSCPRGSALPTACTRREPTSPTNATSSATAAWVVAARRTTSRDPSASRDRARRAKHAASKPRKRRWPREVSRPLHPGGNARKQVKQVVVKEGCSKAEEQQSRDTGGTQNQAAHKQASSNRQAGKQQQTSRQTVTGKPASRHQGKETACQIRFEKHSA